MKHAFSDLRPFRRDPLAFLIERGTSALHPLEPLALGPKPMYLLTDPDLVKPILRMSETVVDKGRLIKKLRSVIGDSVVILSGEEHQKRRAVLHSLLARGAVESLASSFAAEIRMVLAVAAKEQRLDAHDIGSSLALRLVSVAAFGHHVLSAGDEYALIHAVRRIEDDVADEIFRVFPPLPWTAYAQRKRRRDARQTMEMIVKRVRSSTTNSSAVHALASLGLSDGEMANEILTLLLAGHHTTGAAVAWLLHALATVPGLSDEIAREASAMALPNGEIDVSRMPFAKTSIATVREVMRLYPSSWWFSREAKQDVEIGGRRLKAGDSVLIAPWLFHRSTKFWSQPDEFRLDRAYTSSAYIPFGAGPRACVGMGLAMFELQLIALEISAAFSLSIAGTVGPPKPMVMLMPPPIPLHLERNECPPRDLRVA